MDDKYVERTYRNQLKNERLVYFNVTVKQTDLWIGAGKNLYDHALKSILKCRSIIEAYALKYPEFITSFSPVKAAPNAPLIIRKMCSAAFSADVGPMASVAGAISESVGLDLMKYTDEVIVENGGDIYVNCKNDIKTGIFAGESPFSDKFAITIKSTDMPMGICTSSGTIGPSVSFGKSDAVVILSKSTYLADAAATSVANRVASVNDIEKAIEYAKTIKGVAGVVVVCGNKIGAWGKVELAPWN